MKFVTTLVLALLAGRAAFAAQAKPTEESLKQLFAAMQSGRMVDTFMTQIEGTVHASVQQALAGQRPNPQQKQILDDLGSRVLSLIREEVNWANLEPMMIEVYRNTFTQHEVDGMLAFYRSAAGQAMVSKLPAVTQQAMERMQERVRTLTPKIQQLEKDAAAQIRAAREAQSAPPSSAPGAQPPQPPQSQPPPPPPPRP